MKRISRQIPSTPFLQNLDTGLRQSPRIEIAKDGGSIEEIQPPSLATRSRELSRNSSVKILEKRRTSLFLIFTLLMLLAGCGSHTPIISNVHEKEANTIIVLLESKGISAEKERIASNEGGGTESMAKYQILVPEGDVVDAIAYLNQNGFPRRQGTNLLELFAKQGLMSSDKEETIRYQAGLSQQLTNMILMIDGVIDASVQLSFPPDEVLPGQEEQPKKITAAVYVKHQGIMEDPNSFLENKVKRIVSGSVTGLDINDVTVVADKSRYTDIVLGENGEFIGPGDREYVRIWSIIMSKQSAGRFRLFFFMLTFFMICFAIAFGWLLWKFYPVLRAHGGFKELLSGTPIVPKTRNEEE